MLSRRHLALLILAVAPWLSSQVARAQWVENGVPVCTAPNSQDNALVAPDGAGGVFVAWRDLRKGTDDDIYMQHLTAAGEIAAGWPVNGLAVCTAADFQSPTSVISDGAGGVIVAWEDNRDISRTNVDIYAQRITSVGAVAPGWPVNGVAVCTAPEYQFHPRAVGDGAGGAYITWADFRNGNSIALTNADIYAQHVTALGAIAAGWIPNGSPVCTAPGSQFDPSLTTDGAGGVIIAWHDHRNDATTGTHIYAQHFTVAGEIASGWIADGLQISTLTGGQAVAALVADGHGGAFVAWLDGSSVDPALFVHRVTGAGTIVPGWPAAGLLVCIAPFLQPFDIASDGLGGVLLAWEDYRNGSYAVARAQRVNPDGSLPPGWIASGVSFSTFFSYQLSPQVAPDGAGGAFIAFEYFNLAGSYRVAVQHLTASGAVAPGWPATGTPIASTPEGQDYPSIAADGFGGVVVAWHDSRTDGGDIYAQKLAVDGPVPVLVSLVSAIAEPGRATLTWFMAAGSGLTVNVYRRTPSADWMRLGSATTDGTGKITFDDRTAVSGLRYAYRLGYADAGGEAFSAEVWLDIPAGFQLALQGLRPNPAVGELVASFSLPSSAAATLELLDITGRRWLAREVGSLGAGSHLLRLSDGVRVPAGMYWLKLTQNSRSLLAKALVVR